MGKAPLERSVENYLVSRVEKELGGMALKGDVPGRRFLDRILVLPAGVTVYCECKRPIGGRYSRHQLETVERLLKLGHFVSMPHTREQVDIFVENVLWIRPYYSAQTARESMHASAAVLSRSGSPLVLLHGSSSSFDIWSLPHE